MWSTFTLSLILPIVFAAVPPNAPWYTISTKAKVNTMNNLFLSAKGGKIGAFAGTRESAQVAGKFFTSKYDGTQTLSLHAGDDTHQLGLQIQGTKGLLVLVDLVNPSGDTIPKDQPTEWSVFDIASNGELTVKDGQDIPTRKWISYLDTDGVYYVGLWDGVTRQPRSFANITLTATKTSAPK